MIPRGPKFWQSDGYVLLGLLAYIVAGVGYAVVGVSKIINWGIENEISIRYRGWGNFPRQ